MADNTQLFTCLSCSIAFLTADGQRDHYRSDHHRYNMKRRVASLPPISVEVFNQKVLERKTETAVAASSQGSPCEVCNKLYTTENAYRSHLQSKKHKENETKAALRSKLPAPPQSEQSEEKQVSTPAVVESSTPAPPVSTTAPASEDAEDEGEVMKSIDEKIAAARSRLSPTACLFCSQSAASLEDNLTHMSSAHSFFIPDAEYLVDLPGLLTYLGEKIAVGNVCIFCSDRGKEFRTLDAVRKHMIDKGHCKIAYESENDRLEVSDYYDFTTSYPDAASEESDEDEEWEDEAEIGDDNVDEVIDEAGSDTSEELPDNTLSYGDTDYELVLPSGARIGHRSMRRYYAQSFPSTSRGKPEDPNSGAALVRKLLMDKNSALVPRKGAFGAFGAGTDVVKARNKGEAKEAGRHVREFRDQKRRENFKTKVGFIHNSQAHFRVNLLQ